MASSSKGSWTKKFSDSQRETVIGVEQRLDQFQKFVLKDKNFSNTEKKAIQIKDIKEFEVLWQDVLEAKETFEESHRKGYKMWSREYQNTANTIHSFIKEFSPILDIIRDFGGPYCGLAIGTVSVLFAVAKNKHNIEEKLASTLLAIESRLPGMKLYRHIYNDKDELDIRLQEKIVQIYQEFMDFLILSVTYYKGSAIKRWLRAAGPSLDISNKTTNIQKIAVEIRRLCEELLDKNVHRIKEISEEHLMLSINTQLREIRRSLNLQEYSGSTNLDNLEKHRRRIYDSDDPMNSPLYQQMRDRTLEEFFQSDVYQTWTQSDKSQILLLYGSNDEDVETQQCWLSPIAVGAIDSFRNGSSSAACAFHVLQQGGTLIEDVIPKVLLQLLEQNSTVLGDQKRSNELWISLNRYQRHTERNKVRSADVDDRLSALKEVAQRIIDLFDESQQVFLILDRIDRCRNFKKDRDGEYADDRHHLLQTLIEITDVARCKLRILIVVDALEWPEEKWKDRLDVAGQRSMLVHRRHQKQMDE
ncbi:hypothetical protein EV356DRAFT_578033 [Viridothelium virens]|uniref:DUF7708 domain-containing protein n=1 Tax=Viridothelium virens TaxID=1048519 RepID=A0A6A6H5G5_VIRVR|nr:hypothetical protein EV356DRAFT_578033 [Viridothelium virens]